MKPNWYDKLLAAMMDRDAMMLCTAKTLDDLRDMAHNYDRVRRDASVARTKVANQPNKPSQYARTNQLTPSNTKRAGAECYNCGKLGHLSRSCPGPKRDPKSCLCCGKMGHQIKDCKNPSMFEPNPLASITDGQYDQLTNDAADRDATEVDAMNQVSVAFKIGCEVRAYSERLLSLFDTGSPASFIRRSVAPKELSATPTVYTNFKGIGNKKLFSYGQVPMQSKFRNHIGTINVFILADDVLPVPLLLGRDFLNEFGIRMMQYDHDKRADTKQLNFNENKMSESASGRNTKNVIPNGNNPIRVKSNKVNTKHLSPSEAAGEPVSIIS